MKTFDRALMALRGIDLSQVDIYSKQPSMERDITYSTATGEEIQPDTLLPYQEKVLAAYNAFQADPQNKESNETFRATCFEAALAYCFDMAQFRGYSDNKPMPDCWTKAKELVVKHSRGLNFFKEKWGNTNYPLKMMQEWSFYCSTRSPRPFYFDERETSEQGMILNPTIMMVAWHYING